LGNRCAILDIGGGIYYLFILMEPYFLYFLYFLYFFFFVFFIFFLIFIFFSRYLWIFRSRSLRQCKQSHGENVALESNWRNSERKRSSNQKTCNWLVIRTIIGIWQLNSDIDVIKLLS
jgi:hypothetical protein